MRLNLFRSTATKAVAVITMLAGIWFASPGMALAAETEGESAVHHWGATFLILGIVLLVGKCGALVERWGQPAVVGELLAGIILAVFGYVGWIPINEFIHNDVLNFAAAFGALLLLFSIGLESNLKEMKDVGINALLVAGIGVVVPFLLGTFVLGPIFFGDESFNARLFLGAALVATSVGITASVFRSLDITKTRAAQTVLGAAVIDDVLGLVILAVVSSLASGGEFSGMMVVEKLAVSFGFLAAAVILGQLGARHVSKFFSIISAGVGMKLGVALALALIFGYFAEAFGLEPIIGAFAAGLVLDAVHFDRFEDPAMVKDLANVSFSHEDDERRVRSIIKKHRHGHVEDLIGTLNLVFVPIFFVYTGLQIDIGSLLKPELYFVAIVISIAAIFGKIVAGVAAKGGFREKLLVGISMVPRGEVGLIFAATGLSLGVLNGDLFSVVVLVVIITTFIAPPLIGKFGSNIES